MFLINNIVEYKKNIFAWLFDAYHPKKKGGTGVKFDWSIIENVNNKKIFLSGGISLKNIKLAIKKNKPFALDVSSSIEKWPGKKDRTKLIKMIEQVKSL